MSGGRVAGRVAVVTGAARGIGRAIATVLAREGAQVFVADRDVAGGQTTAAAIIDGGVAAALPVDVTDLGSTEAMAASVVSQAGGIDIVCSNVGMYPETPLVEMTPSQWEELLSVNLTGGFLVLRAWLHPMVEAGWGRVVFTSSITGNRTVVPGMAHYAAPKAGLNGRIRAAAVELAPHGITVNGVDPGTVLTEGRGELGPDFIERTSRGIPLGRLAEPKDVANAVLYLASEEAAYVTGETIIVDGGQTLPESGMTAA